MGTENNETTMSAEETQTNKAAFEQMLPLLTAMAEGMLIIPRTDILLAAIFAIGVAKKVNEPARRAIFSKLPNDFFDIALLDRLEPAARAAIFALDEAQAAGALASEAKLPAKLSQEAMEMRGRMLRVLDYHLGHDKEVAALLALVRLGAGYADLSTDLGKLAAIFRSHAEVLAKDPYIRVAEDADTADRLAKTIQNELGVGATPKQKERKELLTRAWTLLFTTYEQIAEPGRWLLKNQGGDALFVSLITAGRKPPRPKSKAPQAALTA